MTDSPSLTAEQLRQLDQRAMQAFNIQGLQLMECAGLAVARHSFGILESRRGKMVFVCAGYGNNGGDAFVAARHLHNWGVRIVVLVTDATKLSGDALQNFKVIEKLDLPVLSLEDPWADYLKAADLVLDGLLGYGLAGAPRAPVSSLIVSLNTSKKPIVAIDIPSGLDATTGEVYTPCIKADFTVTLACLKTGFQVEAAQKVLGEVKVADIGIPLEAYQILT